MGIRTTARTIARLFPLANLLGLATTAQSGGKPSLDAASGAILVGATTLDDRYYTEAEITALLASKSATGHTHDDRYYTEAEVDAAIAAATPDWGDIGGSLANQTDLQVALASKLPLAGGTLTGQLVLIDGTGASQGTSAISFGANLGLYGYDTVSVGIVRSGLTRAIVGGNGLATCSAAEIGWSSSANDATVAKDALFTRGATGPTIDARAAGGLRSRNLANTADAPISGSVVTGSSSVRVGTVTTHNPSYTRYVAPSSPYGAATYMADVSNGSATKYIFANTFGNAAITAGVNPIVVMIDNGRLVVNSITDDGTNALQVAGSATISGNVTFSDTTKRLIAGSSSIRVGGNSEWSSVDTVSIRGSNQQIVFGGAGAYCRWGSNVEVDFVDNGVSPTAGQGIWAKSVKNRWGTLDLQPSGSNIRLLYNGSNSLGQTLVNVTGDNAYLYQYDSTGNSSLIQQISPAGNRFALSGTTIWRDSTGTARVTIGTDGLVTIPVSAVGNPNLQLVGAGSLMRLIRTGISDVSLGIGGSGGDDYTVMNYGTSASMLTINPTSKLATLYGGLKLAPKTIATLPAAAASSGQRYMVTDSVPVVNRVGFSNGAAWYYEDGTAV